MLKKVMTMNFQSKTAKTTSLKNLYEEFLKLIKGSKEPVVLNDIYTHFSKQPFGIKIGVLPILITIFFKDIRRNMCAL